MDEAAVAVFLRNGSIYYYPDVEAGDEIVVYEFGHKIRVKVKKIEFSEVLNENVYYYDFISHENGQKEFWLDLGQRIMAKPGYESRCTARSIVIR
jgi:ribosomal protein L13